MAETSAVSARAYRCSLDLCRSYTTVQIFVAVDASSWAGVEPAEDSRPCRVCEKSAASAVPARDGPFRPSVFCVADVAPTCADPRTSRILPMTGIAIII